MEANLYTVTMDVLTPRLASSLTLKTKKFNIKAKNFLFIVLISLLGFSQVKADTIYYQLPGNGQLCQDPMDFDTFVFHKPNGFGTPVWYSISEQYMLSIYTAPPSHATFELPLGGGQINSANDTVWSCSNTIFVGTPVDGNEATSWYWGNTTGFYSVDAPVTITTSGTYFYHRTNPCGI